MRAAPGRCGSWAAPIPRARGDPGHRGARRAPSLPGARRSRRQDDRVVAPPGGRRLRGPPAPAPRQQDGDGAPRLHACCRRDQREQGRHGDDPGADLASLVKEAALDAVRGRRAILVADDTATPGDPSSSANPTHRMPCRPRRSRPSPFTRPAMPSWPFAPSMPIPLPRSRSSPAALPSARPSSPPSPSATSSPRATSPTPSSCALAGAPPRSSCWACPRPASRTTSRGPSTLPPTWCGSGASRPGSVLGQRAEGASRDNPFAGRPRAEKTRRCLDREVARHLRDGEVQAQAALQVALVPDDLP